MAEGIRLFLSGGAGELPGEVREKVRAAADTALLEGRHVPVRGGPVAPEGWIWVELEDAFSVLNMSGREANDRLLAGRAQEPVQHVLGGAEEWGLVGPVRSWHLEVDQDPMCMLGPGVYYQAWLLVPRGPNWDRAGEWQE
jgi:hypothetical protein